MYFTASGVSRMLMLSLMRGALMPIVAGSVRRCRTVMRSSLALAAVTVTVPSVTPESGFVVAGTVCASERALTADSSSNETGIGRMWFQMKVVSSACGEEPPPRLGMTDEPSGAQAVGGPFANGIAKAGAITARVRAAIPSSETETIETGTAAETGADGAAVAAQVPTQVQLCFSECWSCEAP